MNTYPQLDLTKEKDFQLYAMDNYDCLYMARVDAIREYGVSVSDPERTTDKWRTIPGMVLRLENTAGAFPALLSAEKNWRAAIDETCWFARGETNIETLNSKIWNEWADENGDCGPIYGEMWRRWPDIKVFPSREESQRLSMAAQTRDILEMQRMQKALAKVTELPDGRSLWESSIDQLLNALLQIKARSRSRRIKVQTFNPGYVGMQALPPCHTTFEFNVLPATMYEHTIMKYAHGVSFDESLHIEVSLRSSDTGLGFPFNTIGYTALLHLFAQYCSLNIGSITINTTNTHVYEHHWDGFATQFEQFQKLVGEVRETGKPMEYPILRIDHKIHSATPKELLDNLHVDLFTLEDYNPMPAIKFRVTK